jgi:hypothetical protein
MDKQQEGALAARFGVIEIMLAWFLADMIKRSSEAPEKTAEGIRAILTEMAPKSSRTRPEK